MPDRDFITETARCGGNTYIVRAQLPRTATEARKLRGVHKKPFGMMNWPPIYALVIRVLEKANAYADA